MQVLILYYSKSGNTKKLAEKIGEGVVAEGLQVVVRTTSEVTKDDFANSAGVIAGSPVYFGIMAAQLKQVFDDFVGLRRQMEDKVGAAFATSNHHTGGKETTIMSILQCMMIYGMIIVGDPMDASGHYGVACQKEPDETALSDGFKLGQRVAKLCVKVC